MKDSIKCLFGLHKYEVYKEENIEDARGNVTGKTIINRCKNCGKIKENKIYLVEYK